MLAKEMGRSAFTRWYPGVPESWMARCILILVPVILSCGRADHEQSELLVAEILRYNNPGLVVDLGVGLWAWPLPMDYDGDGDMDLLVSCPDKPYNGLYFFENTADNTQGIPVFEAPVRLGPGLKNLQVSHINGQPSVIGRGVEYSNFREKLFENPTLLYPPEDLEKHFGRIRFSQWRYVDYDADGDLDLIVGVDEWEDYGWDDAFNRQGQWVNGPLHGYVYLLENDGGTYINRGRIQAGGEDIDTYGAPSPNMMDFDGDGDLDLICGEFLDRFTWFENTGTREYPEFAPGRFLENSGGIIRMDLQMIVVAGVDFDMDGDADLVVGDEDGRVAWLENTGRTLDHMPVFKSPVYLKQKADLLKFGALVTPVSVDWDSDGDEDLICGNTAGYIGFIENLDGGDPPSWAAPVYLKAGGQIIRISAGYNGSIQGPAEQKWGYTSLSVADWDGDGLLDIVANSILGEIIWYRNTGEKGSPVLEPAEHIQAEFEDLSPKPAWNWWDPLPGQLVTQWRTTPVAYDWNGDGLTDLVMLDHEGYLSFYERFLENGVKKLHPGKRIFYGANQHVFDNKNDVVDSTGGPLQLNHRGGGGSGRRKITLTDWDSDGDIDLIVNSLNASLFENTGTVDGSVFFMHRGLLAADTLSGHTTSPTTVDWDGDGYPDLLVGAEDGHFYYYRRK